MEVRCVTKPPSNLSAFQVYSSNSKMAQYIRIPFDMDELDNVYQVCQISYHEERVIEINYDSFRRRVVVRDNGEWFWLWSPDIQNLTIFNVLEALGYAGEQIVVTWTDDNQNNALLNSTVQNAALSQMSIYSPNQPIPQNHRRGPLPAIAHQPNDPNADGAPLQNQPIPNNNVNNYE